VLISKAMHTENIAVNEVVIRECGHPMCYLEKGWIGKQDDLDSMHHHDAECLWQYWMFSI